MGCNSRGHHTSYRPKSGGIEVNRVRSQLRYGPKRHKLCTTSKTEPSRRNGSINPVLTRIIALFQQAVKFNFRPYATTNGRSAGVKTGAATTVFGYAYL